MAISHNEPTQEEEHLDAIPELWLSPLDVPVYGPPVGELDEGSRAVMIARKGLNVLADGGVEVFVEELR
jgi:hypothetical protein